MPDPELPPITVQRDSSDKKFWDWKSRKLWGVIAAALAVLGIAVGFELLPGMRKGSGDFSPFSFSLATPSTPKLPAEQRPDVRPIAGFGMAVGGAPAAALAPSGAPGAPSATNKLARALMNDKNLEAYWRIFMTKRKQPSPDPKGLSKSSAKTSASARKPARGKGGPESEEEPGKEPGAQTARGLSAGRSGSLGGSGPSGSATTSAALNLAGGTNRSSVGSYPPVSGAAGAASPAAAPRPENSTQRSIADLRPRTATRVAGFLAVGANIEQACAGAGAREECANLIEVCASDSSCGHGIYTGGPTLGGVSISTMDGASSGRREVTPRSQADLDAVLGGDDPGHPKWTNVPGGLYIPEVGTPVEVVLCAPRQPGIMIAAGAATGNLGSPSGGTANTSPTTAGGTSLAGKSGVPAPTGSNSSDPCNPVDGGWATTEAAMATWRSMPWSEKASFCVTQGLPIQSPGGATKGATASDAGSGDASETPSQLSQQASASTLMLGGGSGLAPCPDNIFANAWPPGMPPDQVAEQLAVMILNLVEGGLADYVWKLIGRNPNEFPRPGPGEGTPPPGPGLTPETPVDQPPGPTPSPAPETPVDQPPPPPRSLQWELVLQVVNAARTPLAGAQIRCPAATPPCPAGLGPTDSAGGLVIRGSIEEGAPSSINLCPEYEGRLYNERCHILNLWTAATSGGIRYVFQLPTGGDGGAGGPTPGPSPGPTPGPPPQAPRPWQITIRARDANNQVVDNASLICGGRNTACPPIGAGVAVVQGTAQASGERITIFATHDQMPPSESTTVDVWTNASTERTIRFPPAYRVDALLNGCFGEYKFISNPQGTFPEAWTPMPIRPARGDQAYGPADSIEIAVQNRIWISARGPHGRYQFRFSKEGSVWVSPAFSVTGAQTEGIRQTADMRDLRQTRQPPAGQGRAIVHRLSPGTRVWFKYDPNMTEDLSSRHPTFSGGTTPSSVDMVNGIWVKDGPPGRYQFMFDRSGAAGRWVSAQFNIVEAQTLSFYPYIPTP